MFVMQPRPLRQLYASEAYFSRDVTGSVIATVQQYLFDNCEYWMDKHNFEQCVRK